MPKPDRKPAPDFEPDYDTADAEFEDAPPVSYAESIDAEYELPADPDYDDSVHPEYTVEIADPEYEEVAEAMQPLEPEPTVATAADSSFAFEVGRTVLPLTQQQPHLIVWRGHLKERHPATGLLHRVPVYRLADGYWDCYREEELRVA
ncbi:MAG: hypothetical protein EOO60_02320 [Hymenobacter sp.]|nr:MAG: hypothetical protein EOO60_02320 [Hymenobacter sp.]